MKIKDLTLEEREKICNQYHTGYKPRFNNCLNCPLCVGEEEFGRAICGKDLIDWVNKEVKLE